MRSERRIHWPGPSKGQDFDLMLEKVGLPYEESARSHPIAGSLLLAVAAAVGVLYVWAVATSIPLLDAYVDLLFVVEPILVGGGLYFLRHRKLRLTAEEASWESLQAEELSWKSVPSDLWPRRTKWVEPISAYAGILRTVADGEGSREGTVFHELVLHHAGDAGKCVKLCSLPNEAGLLHRQERLARLFGLPALSQDGSGVEAIAPQDLHKPLLQRVQEGSVQPAVRAGEPPRRLRLWVQGDAMLMRGRRAIRLGCLLGGFLLVGLGAFFTASAWSFPWVRPWGAAFGLLGLALAFLPVVIVQYLRVSPDGVESWHGLGPLRLGHLDIEAASVRQVTVGKAGYHPLLSALGSGARTGLPTPEAVNVTSPFRTISLGWTLPPEARQWVRDCIIAVLASG
jgi:hypothetical protein